VQTHVKPFASEFDAAPELWDSGDPEAAIAHLEALAVRYPNEAAIHGMLGRYLDERADLVEARPHAEAAVHLSPRSELAARQLFHVLYDLGLGAEALAELRRFHSLTDSEEFRCEWSNPLRQVEEQLGEP
jgi:tetratricopeptide (TPR) repeat protein